MPPQYLSTDPTEGTSTTTTSTASVSPTAGTSTPSPYLSTDDTEGTPAPTPAAAPSRSLLGSVGAFAGEALQSVNPVAINQAIQQTFWHPIETAKGLLSAQDQVRQQAQTAFQRGDYVTGLAKTVDWLIPILGPRLSQAGDYLAQGDVARGLGATVDVAAQVAGPAALKQGSTVRVPSPLNPVTGPEAAAVAFGQARGIPIDAATATGNRFVRGVQAMSESSLLGGLVESRVQKARSAALTRVADELATDVHPTPITPEQAGLGVQEAVRGVIRDQHRTANAAYDTLRQIEANPRAIVQVPTGTAGATTPMALPVDLRTAKTALRPVYDRLTRQLPLTQQQASPALKALENIIKGPDYAPVSVVDADLGALKSLTRGADLPELRDVSQGLAAGAVAQLDGAVRAAAAKGGPTAVRALQDGRTATTAKYAAAAVFEQLRTEPVQAFRQATYAKDTGIAYLRDLAKLAPAEVPKLGRAYLDDLVQIATAEGGFNKASKLATDWQKLGPETKALLFGNRVTELDKFFLLAKRLAESPNPSGTALTLHGTGSVVGTFLHPTTGIPYALGAGAVAKLLNSPRGVALLTDGLRLSLGAPLRRAAWATSMVRALGEEPGLVPVPVTEESPTPLPAAAEVGAR